MSEEQTSANSEVARSGSRGTYIKIGIIAVIVIAALIWLVQWIHFRNNHVSEDDARIKTNEITVSSRVPGRVLNFSLIEGDRLHQNEKVTKLYSRPQELKLKELQERVASIQAQIEYQKQEIALTRQQLQGGQTEARRMLDADHSAMTAAKANLEQARKTYHRAARLYKKGMVSGQQRDQDYYNLLSAQADYQKAQRQVKVDQTSEQNANSGMLINPQMVLPTPKVLTAKLAVTQQQLAEAQSALKRQQVQVDDRVVRSPIQGVVDKTFIQTGEYITPGQPILMMHAPDDVWVEAKVKETKVHKLHKGQPVDIHVDAYPNQTFKGRVQVVGHAATSQFALLPDPNPSGNFTKITQRIPVRIRIDQGPKKKLSPGMMVEVDIDVSGHGGGD